MHHMSKIMSTPPWQYVFQIYRKALPAAWKETGSIASCEANRIKYAAPSCTSFDCFVSIATRPAPHNKPKKKVRSGPFVSENALVSFHPGKNIIFNGCVCFVRERCVVCRTWLEHFVWLAQSLSDFGVGGRLDPIGYIPHMSASSIRYENRGLDVWFCWMVLLCIMHVCPFNWYKLSHISRAKLVV